MLLLPHRHGASLLAAACVLLVAGGQSGAQTPETLRAVRFWSLGNVTRIAIETSGEFQFRSDRLDNPDRLFFDLLGTKPLAADRRMSVIQVGDNYLRRIRVAETQRGITRIVLDLESPVQFTTTKLSNPDRLVVELRGTGTPLESATAKTTSAPVSTAPPPVTPRREFTPPSRQDVTAELPRRTQPVALDPPPSIPATTVDIPVMTARIEPPLRDSVPRVHPAVAVLEKTAPPMSRATTTPSAPADTVVSLPRTTPVISDSAIGAKHMRSGEESMVRALGLKINRVVIDPGHGGHDTGTIGPGGVCEKDIVLDVATRLGALIQQRLGSEVIYTRMDDTFIPLERRTEIANEAKADLFLSIHANSSSVRSAAGVETYYLNFTTSKTALDVAARENSGASKSVFDLQDLIQQIALKDKIEESREFATKIQASMYPLSSRMNAAAKDRGVRKAPFVVLIGASMPSVLAEIGFVSNPRDEVLMKRPEHRQKIAEALYKGISGYASGLSHYQVAQRQPGN